MIPPPTTTTRARRGNVTIGGLPSVWARLSSPATGPRRAASGPREPHEVIMRTVCLILLASLSLPACLPEVKSPATNAPATGEPLAIVDDVRTWTTTYKEKVGDTVYKDESGRTIGTAETYQDRTAVHSVQVWYPVQGRQ